MRNGQWFPTKSQPNWFFSKIVFSSAILKSEETQNILVPTSWPNSIPLKKGMNTFKPKSYAQAVNNGSRHKHTVKPLNRSFLKQREIWVQKREKITRLPGHIPYMKFSAFKAPDPVAWSNESFRNWFTAHEPKISLVIVSTFKDLCSMSVPTSLPCFSASPPSTPTVNTSSILSLSSSREKN
jgi:hypothetical protein